MIKKIPEEFLEKRFKYPESYTKIIELNLVDFDYWYIMNEEQALKRLAGLRQRYPERYLVPFARRDDNDDIACFDLGEPEKVQIIHDFASSGYEQRRTYENLWEWLQEAVNELIESNR
ncbi:hypothetical protein P9B03_13485 [Metasolibacillus meyeri]|uniref:Knr4/Smi1-like domain-containing protein n=1 Tax=Metasolibacillus meyeri TaxID=1071052 RepID=A0AAW9NPN9_9BACL|nr:hypothetical protein [Metasolibacillus meyeri]MEC1179505.1 hypothetical protein [Metasolibacillus meyeri]